MKEVGPARPLQFGSVSTLRPSTCTSSVACPTQVMLRGGGVARRAAPSLATRGASKARGEVRLSHIRLAMKVQRVQPDGRAKVRIEVAEPAGHVMGWLPREGLRPGARAEDKEENRGKGAGGSRTHSGPKSTPAPPRA